MSTTPSLAAASAAATPTMRSSRPSPSPRPCKRPVKLVWTREEDTRQDKFRPHAVVAFKAAAGADGMPTAWSMRVVTSSILASVGRSFPANKVEPHSRRRTGRQRLQRAEHARRSRWSRTRTCRCGSGARPARTSTSSPSKASSTRSRRRAASIPIRCGASCSKESPTGSRCWIPPPRRAIGASRCRKAAAAASPSARIRDSLCAQVAEVTVKPNGEVKVDRVTVALDTRYMVNPLTIAEQAEGSVIFGLSAALYGKITIKDGAAVQGNFDTYRMVRLAEAPKIDVHLVPSGGKVWGGAGEPATPPIAAAVANAIFAATGKRIRTLPIIDHDLHWIGIARRISRSAPGRHRRPPRRQSSKSRGRRLLEEARGRDDNFKDGLLRRCFCCCAVSRTCARPHESVSPPGSHGEYLARAGDCVACHSVPGGKAFAGGLKMGTPLGAIYSTNITPDPETGIGSYSLADFDRAVRQRHRQGRPPPLSGDALSVLRQTHRRGRRGALRLSS